MNEEVLEMNLSFWDALDRLVQDSPIVIDRPKGTVHPKYPDFLYPIDYGYLAGTSSQDGSGIDVWRGTDPRQTIDAVMCIIDLGKRDSEIKLLLGCTEEEKSLIYRVHNEKEQMKGVLIRRECPRPNGEEINRIVRENNLVL